MAAVDVYLSRAAEGNVILTTADGCELCKADCSKGGRVRLCADGVCVDTLRLRAGAPVALTEAEIEELRDILNSNRRVKTVIKKGEVI